MQTMPSSTHYHQRPAGRPRRLSASSIRRWLLLIFPLTVLILAATLVVDVKDLCAHSPHDAIDDLAISPTYDQDQTLFIVIIDQIQRSSDGGSSWKLLVNGLDHNHRLSSVEISPLFSQDNTLFLSSIGAGVFRSRDRGDSWDRVNDGLGTLDIGMMAVQPASQGTDLVSGSLVVLAAGIDNGLFRSENSGDAWEQVPFAAIANARVTALTFAPTGDIAYLGDAQGRLYRSSDRGTTWAKVWDTVEGGAITAIAFSPAFASDGTLFAGTHNAGIFKSMDEGRSFRPANNGLPFSSRDRFLTLRKSKEGPMLRRSELDVTTIAISPNYDQDSTLLAALWNQAIFRSDNGGQTWKRYQLGLSCDYQADSEAYKSPHFRQVRLSNVFASDQTALMGGFDGLFKSTDGGRHWTQMETLPVKLMAGLAAAPSGTDTVGESTYSGLPSIAITTYGGGIYTSGDGGKTWTVRNKGLTTTRLTDIVFSPSYEQDGTILTAAYGRLIQSNPGSDAWTEVEIAQKSWRTYIVNLAKRIGVPSMLTRILLTPAEQERPYPTAFALSPIFESDGATDAPAGDRDGSDRTLYFGTRRHGIFRSLDAGRTASVVWSDSSAGKNSALVSSLAISPNFASIDGQEKGDRTLFAGIYGRGVLKTVDGGETWQEMNNGLTFIERWQSEATQASPGYALERQNVRLAISPNYAKAGGNGGDQTLFAGSGDGLFKTTDGGESWQELTVADLERAYIVALAVSPDYDHDQTIVVSVKGNGLFMSQDGGKTFARIGTELTNSNHTARWLSFSPRYAADGTILAASDEELLVSVNRGDAWQVVDRPVRYEDNREVIHFQGTWTTVRARDISASTMTYSAEAGSTATLHFVGTGTRWLGAQASDGGIAQVYLDGSPVGEVDQFAQVHQPAAVSFEINDLAYGPHTILIQVTGIKNPESTDSRIYVDAIDILGTTSITRQVYSRGE